MFRSAIIRALQKKSRVGTMEELERIADKLRAMARAGDIQAIKELADRVDGKAPQAIVGDGENPILVKDLGRLSNEELEKLARSAD